MAEQATKYEHYIKDRQSLQRLITGGMDALARLGLTSDKATLEAAQEKLSKDSFKVLVLGEFKRGKSTFINALLGEEVLPALVTPCTAVINEIKWDENKRAVLHFTDPPPATFPDAMPLAVREYRAKYRGALPPMPVGVDDIRQYVVIPDPGKDQAESVAESPYRLVEIFWPLPLCKNGVEIIDSPGLNEHGTRTRITTDYLAKVDAVVFVLSCQALGSQSELNVVDQNIRGSGHEDIFFVCNRFDEVMPNDRARLKDYAEKRLEKKTAFGSKGVYFISARDALVGRTGADSGKVDQSGIRPLEEHLASFLVQDRGRVKLMQPARDLRRLMNKVVLEAIPGQKKMMEQSLAKLEQRYAEVKPALEDAERKRAQIRAKVRLGRERLKDGVKREVAVFIKGMASSVPQWLASYEPQSALNFRSILNMKERVGELTKELCATVACHVDQEQAKWRADVLQPFLEVRIQDLGENIREDVARLVVVIDDIKRNVSQVADPGQRDVDPFERVFAAAGGLLVGGIGSGVVGGVLGFSEMLKSLIPAFGVAVAMIALGVMNPFVLIPALLATGSIQVLFDMKKITSEVKNKVGQELASRLRESADETAEKAAADVYAKTESIEMTIDTGLEKEIKSIRESVEAVLAAKRRGEADAQEKSRMLDNLLISAKTIQSDLDDMVFAFQESR